MLAGRKGPSRPFALGLQSCDPTALEPIALHINGNLPHYVEGYLHVLSPAAYVLRDEQNVKLNHWYDGRPLLTRFEFLRDKVLYSNRNLVRRGTTKHAALRKRHEITVSVSVMGCPPLAGQEMCLACHV